MVELDLDNKKVWVDKKKYSVTPREGQLLAYLMAHKGEVCKADAILRDIWGFLKVTPKDRGSLYVHASWLRSKIGEHIQTVQKSNGKPGGYMYIDHVTVKGNLGNLDSRNEATTFVSLKKVAGRRHIEFDMTLPEFHDCIAGDCSYCGRPSITVTRLDDNVGYNLRNVVSVCHDCNELRKGIEHGNLIDLAHEICERWPIDDEVAGG